ncbi:MAG TPA: histidine--tRNA ligase, partial [Syntrophobacteraceae bacterium]|nr:histidine--tRNA ligase [Syntrophobacteraceae bacterium]
IVEKEMYTFADLSGQLLTLRPEATASVVRAFIQHNLQADPLARKFYMMGPMFRHERPQKGRYRQFHQIDAEVFGIDDPMLDAEIMYMLRLLLERIGLSGVVLHINSLGCPQCRAEYRVELKEFLARESLGFCPDCQRRRHTNALRVFDCKVERCRDLLTEAPVLLDHICPSCARHFTQVRESLDQIQTPYVIDARMVRGLDYYTRTTFEVITDQLGAQNAVGGGGRYDGLMKELGGPELPGIGFAMGMERLILLLQQQQESSRNQVDLFVAALGDRARRHAFGLTQELRAQGLATEMDYGGASLKSQMRKADKLQVRFVAILGDAEVDRGELQLRDMTTKTQQAVPFDGALPMLIRTIREGA